jgi:hypothetical protein
MTTRLMLFGIALLGVFSSGRLGDARDAGASQTGLPSPQTNLPPMDAVAPAGTETATFALG